VARIPEDAAHTCTEQCSQLGSVLGGMVTMAGRVGCVCLTPDRAAESSTTATAAVASMAAALANESEAQQAAP
jgi:hypothetical protein